MVDVVKSLSSKCTVLESPRLRKDVRAPAPLPRHPERHMEQRHGQGHRPGIRWREILEECIYCTIAEIAAAEKIMSLTWLASCD